MSPSAEYKYATRTNGEVVIFHHGKMAKMMREEEAQKFLAAVKDGDEQAVMAQAVGNDGQAARPTSGTGPSGKSVHGDGAAHGHKEFRRKSGG
jgi:hypothetical protein